jgi:hypothetical protein
LKFTEQAHRTLLHIRSRTRCNGNVILSGGAWKLQRSSFVKDNLEKISQIGYDDKKWILQRFLEQFSFPI